MTRIQKMLKEYFSLKLRYALKPITSQVTHIVIQTFLLTSKYGLWSLVFISLSIINPIITFVTAAKTPTPNIRSASTLLVVWIVRQLSHSSISFSRAKNTSYWEHLLDKARINIITRIKSTGTINKKNIQMRIISLYHSFLREYWCLCTLLLLDRSIVLLEDSRIWMITAIQLMLFITSK